MNDIKIFNNPKFGDVRTTGTPEEPLFCALDVARALGYSNPAKAVIDHCKGVTVLETPTKGGIQKLKFISEPEVYRLIFKSNAPNAEEFNSWVAEDVLPSIRKTGGYIVSTPDMTDDEIMARALIVAQATITKRDQRIRELEEETKQKGLLLREANTQVLALTSEIEEMKPKASYYDMILNNKSTVLTTQIAQDYGMSAKKMNRILADMRIQRKVNDQWILYAPYVGCGYVQSKPVDIVRKDGRREIKYNTEWTQKGRIFLYDSLKQRGILPLIERC